jgi:hypothetical protein
MTTMRSARLDGGKAVRNDDAGAARDEVIERVLDEALAFGVEAGGGLVEDEDGGVLDDGAGDGEALALAAGKACAAFAR